MAPKTDQNSIPNCDCFHDRFFSGLGATYPARLPTGKRAGAVDVVGGGTSPSPLGLRGGFVDLISGLARGLHALRLSASADFHWYLFISLGV